MELVLNVIRSQKLILEFHFDHSTSIIGQLSSVDTLPRLHELKLSCADVTVRLLL